MNELMTRLEAARRVAPPVRDDLVGLYRRGARRSAIRRVGVAVVALAIGLGAIVGVIVAFSSGRTAAYQPADTGATKTVSAPSTDLTMGADDYYVERIDGRYVTSWALDGAGRIVNLHRGGDETQSYDPGRFPSDTGPAAYLSTNVEQLRQQLVERVQPGGASPEPYADWGGPIEWGLIRSIRELLDSPDVTPAQKAAVFQLATSIDGVQTNLHASDPEGRPAILLTSNTEHIQHEWWFDPSSHQMLARRDTFNNGSDDTEIVQAAGFASSVDAAHLERPLIPPTISGLLDQP
jgi:hypothetical protein